MRVEYYNPVTKRTYVRQTYDAFTDHKPYLKAYIGCGATKKPFGKHRAEELYQGDLFQKSLAYAKKMAAKVYILSAKHGVLELDDMIESYDVSMNDLGRSGLREWNDKVDAHVGLTTFFPTLVLAGNDYCQWLENRPDWGGRIDRPLKGMGIGSQKKWLKEQLCE